MNAENVAIYKIYEISSKIFNLYDEYSRLNVKNDRLKKIKHDHLIR